MPERTTPDGKAVMDTTPDYTEELARAEREGKETGAERDARLRAEAGQPPAPENRGKPTREHGTMDDLWSIIQNAKASNIDSKLVADLEKLLPADAGKADWQRGYKPIVAYTPTAKPYAQQVKENAASAAQDKPAQAKSWRENAAADKAAPDKKKE